MSNPPRMLSVDTEAKEAYRILKNNPSFQTLLGIYDTQWKLDRLDEAVISARLNNNDLNSELCSALNIQRFYTYLGEK